MKVSFRITLTFKEEKMRKFSLFFAFLMIISFVLFLTVCDNGSTSGGGNVLQIAEEAFTFGLPLVLVDITRRQLDAEGEMNQFLHDTVLPDHTFREFVRPNVDTLYSNAFLDLSGGPILLSLPDMDNRYHLMQLMDAYTNVFGSPGTRTTDGNTSREFLIAGPGWTSSADYRSPTNYVWILGRTLVNSGEDVKNVVVPIMETYTLTRHPSSGPLAKEDGPVISMINDANEVVAGMPIDVFFNYLNHLMVINPPSSADHNNGIVRRMAGIGVGPGATFNLAHFSAEEQAAMLSIPQKVMADLIRRGQYEREFLPVLETGWSSTMANGMGNYGTNYPFRAFIALTGIGANLPLDAVYFSVAGLDGSQRYVLRFPSGETPPVVAFWSLTLYAGDYLSENTLRRYAVGDRSGLAANEDGSIDIYIQHTNFGIESGKMNNWLPAPGGNFNLTLRAYIPKEDLLNGSWRMPQITTVE